MAATHTFTLDQRKAHDAGRHLSITANAGSGKTRVLVSRYCDIVQWYGVLPSSIAAVTFTEKAASELRTRIAAELEERLGDEEHKWAWERLKLAREQFTSAVVTTIHGFCSQLLREYPIETDVPPNFSVLSGYERRQIEEESLNGAVEEMLNGPRENPTEITAAYETARRISREQLEETLRLMLWKREPIEFSARRGVLALDRDQTLRLWRDRIDQTVQSALVNSDTLSACAELTGHLKEKYADEPREALAALRRSNSTFEIVSLFRSLRDALLTQKGELRRSVYDLPRDQIDLLLPAAERLTAALDRAGAILSADTDPLLHETLYDDTQTVLSVYRETIRRYEARKARINALDFEDLQLRLLKALDDPEARARIVGRFTTIMVDEFQDTNEIQYSIASQLLDELHGEGKLCIVGDRKQSIYGFRNADVTVFDTANADIKQENARRNTLVKGMRFREETIMPESTEEALGMVKLDASFRLLPSNCAYVNEACAPVMKPEGTSAFGVDYEPLVCARRSEGRGRIEFILNGPEPKPADDEEEDRPTIIPPDPDWCPEPEMIARRILEIVTSGESLVWEPETKGAEETPRPPRFSDIALLCRKRSHFPALESAFRKYGIPFLTHGSIGFYKTQEVYDVVGYLRVLLNSRDDVALLGVLRSPFFSVSDAELYRMAQLPEVREENSLWARAERWARDPRSHEALRRAVETITDDRAMASRIPVQILMRRFLERTGWRGAVIGSEKGEQALANIDKLLEMARDFESQGFTNLFDFVQQLTSVIDMEEMEGEAAVNTGRDAVHLMTIHAAKGLEFPVVILPSLHSPTPGPSPIRFDKELGFGWNWTFNKEEQRPAITALMGLRAAERERAEETRLFYVALTRARDLLVLSGEYDHRKPPKNTMLNWALGPFDEAPTENTSLTLVTDRLRFLEEDGATERSERWEQGIDFRLTIADRPRYAPASAAVTPFRIEEIRIGELPARAEGDIYSASQFLVYNQCPTKYYLKYRLGIPEDITAAYDPNFDPDARDSEDGTAFARLFRRAALRIDEALAAVVPGAEPEELPRAGEEFLEAMYGRDIDSIAVMVDERAPVDPAPFTDDSDMIFLAEDDDRDPIERIADEALLFEPLPADQRERLRERLIDTLRTIGSTEEARTALAPPGARAWVEHELRIPFERDYLLGVMDRLIVGEDGAPSVLHYKTRRLAPDEETRAAAESYLPQLRLYSYLVSLLLPDRKTIQATILFTERPWEPQLFLFTKFDMRRVEDELRSAFDDIRALSYTGRRTLPLRTPHCPDCPYWIDRICLLGRASSLSSP